MSLCLRLSRGYDVIQAVTYSLYWNLGPRKHQPSLKSMVKTSLSAVLVVVEVLPYVHNSDDG